MAGGHCHGKCPLTQRAKILKITRRCGEYTSMQCLGIFNAGGGRSTNCHFCLLQIPEETNVLTDGCLVDLCGVTLMWRTAIGLEQGPVRMDTGFGREIWHIGSRQL